MKHNFHGGKLMWQNSHVFTDPSFKEYTNKYRDKVITLQSHLVYCLFVFNKGVDFNCLTYYWYTNISSMYNLFDCTGLLFGF